MGGRAAILALTLVACAAASAHDATDKSFRAPMRNAPVAVVLTQIRAPRDVVAQQHLIRGEALDHHFAITAPVPLR